MTTTGRPCDLCARPNGDDAYACTSCADRAASALRSVHAWLAEALEDAVGKRTALGGGKAGGKPTKASEAPFPLDLRASEAAAVLRNTLAGWVRVAREESPGASLPPDTIAGMARWLSSVPSWARHRPWGPEMLDEVPAAVRQALRSADLPVRTVPLPEACRAIALDGQTPRACGGKLIAIVAPGLRIDGQIRCQASREHTTTVLEEEQARRRAGRVIRARLRTA